MASEQGHYEVTLHGAAGEELARRTYPFGQWDEIGFWLDEVAAEGESVAITLHPLVKPKPSHHGVVSGRVALLALPLEELELGVRAYNILKRRGIDTCGDVLTVTEWDLDRWAQDDPNHRFGHAAEVQLREAQKELRRRIRELPPEGSTACACGAVTHWEGEPAGTCLRCGRELAGQQAGRELPSHVQRVNEVLARELAGLDLDAAYEQARSADEFSRGLGEINASEED